MPKKKEEQPVIVNVDGRCYTIGAGWVGCGTVVPFSDTVRLPLLQLGKKGYVPTEVAQWDPPDVAIDPVREQECSLPCVQRAVHAIGRAVRSCQGIPEVCFSGQTIVSTDSIRAILARTGLFLTPEERTVVLYRPLREALEWLLRSDSGRVTVRVSNETLLFVSGQWAAEVRTSHRHFPNFESILPKGHGMTVTIPSDSLAVVSGELARLKVDKKNTTGIEVLEDGIRFVAKSPNGDHYRSIEANTEFHCGNEPRAVRFCVSSKFLSEAVFERSGTVTWAIGTTDMASIDSYPTTILSGGVMTLLMPITSKITAADFNGCTTPEEKGMSRIDRQAIDLGIEARKREIRRMEEKLARLRDELAIEEARLR